MLSRLCFNKTIAVHGLVVAESLRLKQATGNGFFKMSSSCACRRAKARSCRNSAVVAGSSVAPRATAMGISASFCHL